MIGRIFDRIIRAKYFKFLTVKPSVVPNIEENVKIRRVRRK